MLERITIIERIARDLFGISGFGAREVAVKPEYKATASQIRAALEQAYEAGYQNGAEHGVQDGAP